MHRFPRTDTARFRCTGVSTMARTLGNTMANTVQYKSNYNGQNNSKHNGRYSGQHNGTGASTRASTLANTMANTRANTMARTRASTQHARPSSHVETLAVFGRPAPHRWSSATDFPCLRQLPPPPKRAPAQKGSDVEKDEQT